MDTVEALIEQRADLQPSDREVGTMRADCPKLTDGRRDGRKHVEIDPSIHLYRYSAKAKYQLRDIIPKMNQNCVLDISHILRNQRCRSRYFR